jgi:hypothetical protein
LQLLLPELAGPAFRCLLTTTAKKVQAMPTHVEDLIAHPHRYFGRPGDVLADSSLTADDKLKVLESWKQDAARLAESTAENMTGGEESDLRDVSKALLELKAVEPTLAIKPKGRPRSGKGGASIAGGLLIGAVLGAGAGLVAIAITGPSLVIVAQTTVVGLILGGVVGGVRGTAV